MLDISYLPLRPGTPTEVDYWPSYLSNRTKTKVVPRLRGALLQSTAMSRAQGGGGEDTRFSNSGFCHLGVNFFVFCRNLKTKTDLKSLCNFQIECGISKDLMIKFLPKIKKMLFFSVFDLIFLRVFSFFSVKNMSFLV